MPKGYTGVILHANLSTGELREEKPEEALYRTYMGGSGLAMDYILKMMPPGTDPLGPDNVLVISIGVLTGAPISGLSRVMVNAKSPLTGAIGDSQGGGFWPAELKFAGYDAIVATGRAEKPVYLWLHDGQAELRDASHLWGKVTGVVEATIREELGDRRIQVLQAGPAGERGVRFACIINTSNRACGRTGMGAVMGSKNLKAIAVRGTKHPEIHDREKLRQLAKWGRENFEDSGLWAMGLHGTANAVEGQQQDGGLPTRNWSSGVFEGWEKIWGQTMSKTILKERDTCYGCIVRCKRVVELEEPYHVDPLYGGPEYETVATMGSYCGVDDLAAIAKASELCNKYGMDTISCGATVAFAMDCFEHGILTTEDTGGLELRFGNAEAMVKVVEMIAKREGLGDILAEGSFRAAQRIGKGAEAYQVTARKQEFPAHMPQPKRSFALIYAVNPFGADHVSSEHDPSYGADAAPENLERLSSLGLIHPQPTRELTEEKIRFALYTEYQYSALDCLGTCVFVWGGAWQLYGPNQLVELVRAITGWDTSLFEIMKVGERRLNLMRVFNAREGFTAKDDVLPPKAFVPLTGGATDGLSVSEEEALRARQQYYAMAGWTEEGVPTEAKLRELGLTWAAELL